MIVLRIFSNVRDFIIKGRGKEGDINHKIFLILSEMLESEETVGWNEDGLEVQMQIKFTKAILKKLGGK